MLVCAWLAIRGQEAVSPPQEKPGSHAVPSFSPFAPLPSPTDLPAPLCLPSSRPPAPQTRPPLQL